MNLKLNREQLKLIAIISMVIDHVAWGFVEFYSPLGQFLHVCGRLTIPIMCFFIAEGFRKTSNLKKYIDRMAAFGLLAAIPFYVFFHEEYGYRVNIIFDLLFALLALTVMESKLKKWQKVLGMIALFGTSMAIGGWPIAPILFVLAFYYGRTFKEQAKWFIIIDVTTVAVLVVAISLNSIYHFSHYNWVWWDKFYQLGFMLALPLLRCYNGEKGKTFLNRYFFYLFYPIHFIVLALIKWALTSDASAYQIDLGIHVTALIICWIVVVLASRCRPSRGQSAILLFLISASMYVFGFILEITSTSVETFHHAIMVEYFGEVMCFIGLTYFISVLCKIQIPFSVYVLQAILGMLVMYSLFMTLDNGFFYREIAVNTSGPFPRPILTYGPGFYLTIIYIAVLSLLCLGACIRTYRVGNHLDRKRITFTIIGMVCVWLPYPIKLLGLTGGYEIPGVGITCAGVLFYQILIRYGFLDSVTLAGENVLDHGDEGIVVLGTDYRIQYHNRQVDAIFGDIPHDIDLRTNQWLGKVLAGGCDTLELNGRIYEFRVETLSDSGYEQGKMIWIHDATEHHISMERVREIAIKDPLTQLFNRVHYQELVEEHLKQSCKGAFLMIDMDNFKKVNDKYGHQVGDDVLKVFAKVLKSYEEQKMIACRMGGDEFSVFILDETEEKKLGGIIQHMMDEYQIGLSEYGYENDMGLSIGAVIFDTDNSKRVSFANMYNAADQVLYQVKKSGKNSYEIELLK